MKAADAIRLKMAHLVNHPLTMLSKLYDFWQVKLHPSEFELDDRPDVMVDHASDDAQSLHSKSELDKRKDRTVDFATDEAILNAKLLHRQGLELIQKHGEKLHEFVMEPLKSLYQAEMMALLLEFSHARHVNWEGVGLVSSKNKKYYRRSASASQVGLEGLGGVDPKSKRPVTAYAYPLPVTAYPALANLALMACTMTTNNNNVESKWSLLTYRYHAHMFAMSKQST